MALRENTTVNDSQLEHIIIEKDLEKRLFATSYFNLASDHRSIIFRISSPANSFTDTFKQRINFESDLHMKKTSKKKREEEAANQENYKEILETADQEKSNDNVPNHHLKLLCFINPKNRNLCFSNSVVSALLNLSTFSNVFSKETESTKLYAKRNKAFAELLVLKNLSNFSRASTQKLRSIVSSACDDGIDFDDNFQHDAGEFLVALFEQLFRDFDASNNIDEQIFGGLFKEEISCKCGNLQSVPVQKLSEILMIQLCGRSLQSCLTDFLSDEEIDFDCKKCSRKKAVKKINFVIEPSTLILQLKRYEYDIDAGKSIKIHSDIKCPETLIMPNGSTYSLSSIINHIGDSPSEGHYNEMIFDPPNDSYVLVDDLDIAYDVKNETSKLCYIVFYTKDSQ